MRSDGYENSVIFGAYRALVDSYSGVDSIWRRPMSKM